MFVGMQVPRRIHSNALGISHLFRQDGHIEVFYSRIQNYTPEFCQVWCLPISWPTSSRTRWKG
jgi:hypothetical protein